MTKSLKSCDDTNQSCNPHVLSQSQPLRNFSESDIPLFRRLFCTSSLTSFCCVCSRLPSLPCFLQCQLRFLDKFQAIYSLVSLLVKAKALNFACCPPLARHTRQPPPLFHQHIPVPIISHNLTIPSSKREK